MILDSEIRDGRLSYRIVREASPTCSHWCLDGSSCFGGVPTKLQWFQAGVHIFEGIVRLRQMHLTTLFAVLRVVRWYMSTFGWKLINNSRAAQKTSETSANLRSHINGVMTWCGINSRICKRVSVDANKTLRQIKWYSLYVSKHNKI